MGAWLGGRLYDTFGNYDIMWGINLVAGLAAFLLHVAIRERPVMITKTA